jgi:hypothetical protein
MSPYRYCAWGQADWIFAGAAFTTANAAPIVPLGRKRPNHTNNLLIMDGYSRDAVAKTVGHFSS